MLRALIYSQICRSTLISFNGIANFSNVLSYWVRTVLPDNTDGGLDLIIQTYPDLIPLPPRQLQCLETLQVYCTFLNMPTQLASPVCAGVHPGFARGFHLFILGERFDILGCGVRCVESYHGPELVQRKPFSFSFVCLRQMAVHKSE